MNTLKIEGNLASYKECNEAFEELKNMLDKYDLVIFDLADVKYMSSAGIGRMASLDKSLWDTEKKVKVININNDMKSILKNVELPGTLRKFEFEGLQ